MGNGHLFMTERNYQEMSRKELKEYLLLNRHDEEAWAVFFEKLSHVDKAKAYPANLPNETMEQIFKDKLAEISKSNH
ncbi:MAG: hypothetical protein N5P05_004586 [Chroococcopsis gigantea SAG 12.99]|nr:hypothetical protein [Chroococcopsis gigantea SAG 12.99]